MSLRGAAAAAVVIAVGIVVVLLLARGEEDEPPVGVPEPPPTGFVERKGNRLYVEDEPYRFVGLNVYWANNRLDVGCGPAVDDASLERGFDAASAAGNAIRAWFLQSQATVAGVRDWTAFDRTLRIARERGLRVIVTLAEQHGTCGDPPVGAKHIGWYEEGYATEIPAGYPQTYRDYVRDVVRRYADSEEILAWQLINEASAVTIDGRCPDDDEAALVLREWADDVAGMIRSIDENHLISLGTGLQGSCGITVTDDPTDNNYRYVHASPEIDLCEYHDYNAPTEPLFGLMQQEMDTCADLDKAFFVGELGIPAIQPGRPELVAAKLEAQFNYPPEPSQGALLWSLGGPELGPCDQNCVVESDPLVEILSRYED